jgi:hypothetical protein
MKATLLDARALRRALDAVGDRPFLAYDLPAGR